VPATPTNMEAEPFNILSQPCAEIDGPPARGGEFASAPSHVFNFIGSSGPRTPRQAFSKKAFHSHESNDTSTEDLSNFEGQGGEGELLENRSLQNYLAAGAAATDLPEQQMAPWLETTRGFLYRLSKDIEALDSLADEIAFVTTQPIDEALRIVSYSEEMVRAWISKEKKDDLCATKDVLPPQTMSPSKCNIADDISYLAGGAVKRKVDLQICSNCISMVNNL